MLLTTIEKCPKFLFKIADDADRANVYRKTVPEPWRSPMVTLWKLVGVLRSIPVLFPCYYVLFCRYYVNTCNKVVKSSIPNLRVQYM